MTTEELRSPDFKAPRQMRELLAELEQQRQRMEALRGRIEGRP